MHGRRVVDEGALDRLDRIGGNDFVVEMIELFLENAPQRLERARQALDEGDVPTLHRAVHSLKSTSANVGARAMQETAATAERRADDQDLAALRPLLEDLDRHYGEVKEALAAERDRRKSG